MEYSAARRAVVAFIERRYWKKGLLAFSLEKVFEQVARLLPADRFETMTVKAPYGNTGWETIRNLFGFRPPAADVYHITGQIHYLALRLPPDRTVLTIHDLAFLDFYRTGGPIRRWLGKKLFLDLPVRRVRYLTAVSEATRSSIIAKTGCPPDKVRVIPDPVQEHFLTGQRRPFNKACPTILQVGITENKNIPALIDAIKGLRCRLVIVGNLPDDLRARLETEKIDFQARLGLDDQQMREAYEQADIVSFCSTFEGFGLPIIEGQSMLTPVLTSDIEPMRSVAGEGACLVDPFSSESIRAGLLRIIEDDEFREQIITLGAANAEKYQPERIAAEYRSIYETILKNN